MKKLLTICLCLSLSFTAIYAQEAEKSQNFQHEFGIDVTDLMRQFLFSSGGFFPTVENVTESYTLSYRLMYKDKINLRLGVGGNFRNSENTRDTVSFNLDGTAIRYRIGVDKIEPISKRWEAYYGIDFFQEQTETNNSSTSTTNNYINRRNQIDNRLGVSPLIGVRFRFNDRVGLQTSLNVELYKSLNTYNSTFEVLNSNLAAVLPANQEIITDTNGLDINIPINLVLTFRL